MRQAGSKETQIWYSAGYPALRQADKKIREIRAKQENQKRKESLRPPRRSRSYSRGKSVFFNSQDPNIPYYRSKSVELSRENSMTFEPVVNEHDVINMTYTGRARSTDSLASGRSKRSRHGSGIVQKQVKSVVPHMRDDYVFDDLQTRIYQQIQKVYGEPDADEKHKQFFLTFAQIQADHLQMQKMKITKDDRKFLEKMFSEIQSLKKETGKILKNSSKRYSTQFEQPSPVNAKVRRLPRGKKDENFMKVVPRYRDRLRVKPFQTVVHGDSKMTDLRNYQTFDEYGKYSRQSGFDHPANYQRVIEPTQRVSDKQADMLRFLQQAEKLLRSYKTGLFDHPLSEYKSRDNLSPQRRNRPVGRLNPLPNLRSPQRNIPLMTKSYHESNRKSLSPIKPVSRSPTKPVIAPKKPVYRRPDAHYDPRQHIKVNSLMNKMDHQLYEARKSNTVQRLGFSLHGLAK